MTRSGNPPADTTLTFPKDSIQHYVTPWWCVDEGNRLRRGRLINAYIPYIPQQPSVLIAEGREEPTEHSRINYKITPFNIKDPPQAPRLPVAALPINEKERLFVYKTKKRPAIVLNCGGTAVDKSLRIGAASWQTTLTISIAPYFGTDGDGTRAGWREEFVTRIRHAEYPQYLWDILPIGGTSSSVLRLDQTMPIGKDLGAFSMTKYFLSEDALQVLDEWREWLDLGRLADTSTLSLFRSQWKPDQ
jgi:hypothetical protein